MESAIAEIAVDGYTVLSKVVPESLCNNAIQVVERETGRLVEQDAHTPQPAAAIPFASLVTSPAITRLYTVPRLDQLIGRITGLPLHPVSHGQVAWRYPGYNCVEGTCI